MSDWEDYEDKPNAATNARPAPTQSRQNNFDDWGDEPQNVCTIFRILILCSLNRKNRNVIYFVGKKIVLQQQKRYDDRRDSSRNRENRRSNYNNNNNNSNMDGNGEQLTFTVSQTSVGLVIGRGGSNIKDLEQKYRVKVNIGKY